MAAPALKDQLFNAQTIGQLAAEYAAALPAFDAQRFTRETLAGFHARELLARMEWIADCVQAQLPRDFESMAEQLEAAMPQPLSPDLGDDDFGQFIHAIPGILAARHGLEAHRTRAMTLLYRATKRFTVEFYIRAFLIRWPQQTLEDLALWASDPNYHVRRLVSEGTRPRLPWARNVGLAPAQTVPLLDALHGDPTRYVTRSVANHLNDLSKTVPDLVLDCFARWEAAGIQSAGELDWMKRHALRSLVKKGHAGALGALGFRADADVVAQITLGNSTVRIGDSLAFDVMLSCEDALPVLVDYRLTFARAGGKTADKVFKLGTRNLPAGLPVTLSKAHKMKGGASTFTLYEGAHAITVQVNGRDVAHAQFTLHS